MTFEGIYDIEWWFDYFVIFEIMAISLSFMFKNESTFITICGLSVAGMQALHLFVMEGVYEQITEGHEDTLANQSYLLGCTNIV